MKNTKYYLLGLILFLGLNLLFIQATTPDTDGVRLDNGNTMNSIVTRYGDIVQKEVKQGPATAQYLAAYVNQVADHFPNMVPRVTYTGGNVLTQSYVDGYSLEQLVESGDEKSIANAMLQWSEFSETAQKKMKTLWGGQLMFILADQAGIGLDDSVENFKFDRSGNLKAWFDPIYVHPPALPSIGIPKNIDSGTLSSMATDRGITIDSNIRDLEGSTVGRNYPLLKRAYEQMIMNTSRVSGSLYNELSAKGDLDWLKYEVGPAIARDPVAMASINMYVLELRKTLEKMGLATRTVWEPVSRDPRVPSLPTVYVDGIDSTKTNLPALAVQIGQLADRTSIKPPPEGPASAYSRGASLAFNVLDDVKNGTHGAVFRYQETAGVGSSSKIILGGKAFLDTELMNMKNASNFVYLHEVAHAKTNSYLRAGIMSPWHGSIEGLDVPRLGGYQHRFSFDEMKTWWMEISGEKVSLQRQEDLAAALKEKIAAEPNHPNRASYVAKLDELNRVMGTTKFNLRTRGEKLFNFSSTVLENTVHTRGVLRDRPQDIQIKKGLANSAKVIFPSGGSDVGEMNILLAGRGADAENPAKRQELLALAKNQIDAIEAIARRKVLKSADTLAKYDTVAGSLAQKYAQERWEKYRRMAPPDSAERSQLFESYSTLAAAEENYAKNYGAAKLGLPTEDAPGLPPLTPDDFGQITRTDANKTSFDAMVAKVNPKTYMSAADLTRLNNFTTDLKGYEKRANGVGAALFTTAEIMNFAEGYGYAQDKEKFTNETAIRIGTTLVIGLVTAGLIIGGSFVLAGGLTAGVAFVGTEGTIAAVTTAAAYIPSIVAGGLTAGGLTLGIQEIFIGASEEGKTIERIKATIAGADPNANVTDATTPTAKLILAWYNSRTHSAFLAAEIVKLAAKQNRTPEEEALLAKAKDLLKKELAKMDVAKAEIIKRGLSIPDITGANAASALLADVQKIFGTTTPNQAPAGTPAPPPHVITQSTPVTTPPVITTQPPQNRFNYETPVTTNIQNSGSGGTTNIAPRYYYWELFKQPPPGAWYTTSPDPLNDSIMEQMGQFSWHYVTDAGVSILTIRVPASDKSLYPYLVGDHRGFQNLYVPNPTGRVGIIGSSRGPDGKYEHAVIFPGVLRDYSPKGRDEKLPYHIAINFSDVDTSALRRINDLLHSPKGLNLQLMMIRALGHATASGVLPGITMVNAPNVPDLDFAQFLKAGATVPNGDGGVFRPPQDTIVINMGSPEARSTGLSVSEFARFGASLHSSMIAGSIPFGAPGATASAALVQAAMNMTLQGVAASLNTLTSQPEATLNETAKAVVNITDAIAKSNTLVAGLSAAATVTSAAATNAILPIAKTSDSTGKVSFSSGFSIDLSVNQANLGPGASWINDGVSAYEVRVTGLYSNSVGGQIILPVSAAIPSTGLGLSIDSSLKLPTTINSSSLFSGLYNANFSGQIATQLSQINTTIGLTNSASSQVLALNNFAGINAALPLSNWQAVNVNWGQPSSAPPSMIPLASTDGSLNTLEKSRAVEILTRVRKLGQNPPKISFGGKYMYSVVLPNSFGGIYVKIPAYD